tara:strand:- start:56 stop:427 length:372 start_codon:yes stop_codon:yes gene_type:complete
MIYLIFNSSDGSFHMASSSINKFYENNTDFVIKEFSDWDPEYSYTLVDDEVAKGDLIEISDEETAEIEASVVAAAHHTPRILAFPSVGEQLDLLYHDIDNNKLDKTGEFYKTLKAVKDSNPKQ